MFVDAVDCSGMSANAGCSYTGKGPRSGVMSANASGCSWMLYVVLLYILVIAENRGLTFQLLMLYVVY